MANIPEDIKKGLKSLATTLKVDPKTLVEQLKDIITTDDVIKNMPEEQKEFKVRYAWAVLLRRHTSRTTESQMYLKPLSRPRARQVTSQGVKKYVGDIYALIKRIETDDNGNQVVGDVEYGVGTLWEKAAERAIELSPDKVYKTALRTVSKSANIGSTVWEGVELGGNDATFTEVTDVKFPTTKEYYDENIKPLERDLTISWGELDLNNQENPIDIRVIKSMVVDVLTGETANGDEFGQYITTDDSMLGGGTDGNPGSISIWMHPSEAIYEKGSILTFVGTTKRDTNADIQRWSNHFCIGEKGLALPRSMESKPVEKEAVDIGDLDAELDKEHKKATESLDDDFEI